MKNIETILKETGLTDEQKQAVMSEIKANYKTIGDYQKQSDKLASAEKTIQTQKTEKTDLETKLQNISTTFDGKNAEEWAKELEKVNKEIADNAKIELEKQQEETLTNSILANIGEQHFVNDFTKNAIISEVKEALKQSENTGKSHADIFKAITNNREGIFKPTHQQKSSEKIKNDLDNSLLDEMTYDELTEYFNNQE